VNPKCPLGQGSGNLRQMTVQQEEGEEEWGRNRETEGTSARGKGRKQSIVCLPGDTASPHRHRHKLHFLSSPSYPQHTTSHIALVGVESLLILLKKIYIAWRLYDLTTGMTIVVRVHACTRVQEILSQVVRYRVPYTKHKLYAISRVDHPPASSCAWLRALARPSSTWL
jgi:hypothetical protein